MTKPKTLLADMQTARPSPFRNSSNGNVQSSLSEEKTLLLAWDKPIPFPTDPVLPGFPLGCLPSWLACWVEAEASSTQTPPDLAAMLTL
jgi:hypothetical protein